VNKEATADEEMEEGNVRYQIKLEVEDE